MPRAFKYITAAIAITIAIAIAIIATLYGRGEDEVAPIAQTDAPNTRSLQAKPAMSGVDVVATVETPENPQGHPMEIIGKVLDPFGAEAQGAQVDVWRASDAEGEARLCRESSAQIVASITTDSQGAFTLSLPHDDRFCARAHHEQWADSEPQTIRTDDAPTLSMQLSLQHPLRISGRAVDVNRAPMQNVALRLTRRDGPASARIQTTTDTAGAFTFARVAAGEYALESADARFGISRPRELIVRSGERIDDLLVTMHALTAITGRVFDANAIPLADVRVTARSLFDAELTLGSAVTDAQGRFVLQSEHRSEAALGAQRLAIGGVDKRGAERPSITASNHNAVCIEFQHTKFQAQIREVTATVANMEISPVYLQTETRFLLGALRDERQLPIAGRLIFRPTDFPVVSSNCDQLPLVRHITTNPDGTFNAHLPAPANYEVEVHRGDTTHTVPISIPAGASRVDVTLPPPSP